jgi:glycosyltransferase involved in cell wall biosynthesis
VVLNGLDTAIFRPYSNADALRAELGVGLSKMIFHATPMFTNDPNHIKGGYYILRVAEEFLARGIDAKFVIAGDYPDNLTVPPNVILLGRVADQTRLAMLYAAADLTILASKRETFSMIVAESLSCGTPVVGFEAGAPEQITISAYSRFVEYGNVEALCTAACEMLDADYDRASIAKAGMQKYDKGEMVHRYIEIYKENK